MLLKACEILELLSKTPGRLDKEKILRDNKDNEELKFLFETAFNPYLIYGVKDFALTINEAPIISFEMLKGVRLDLINGIVTGNAAKQRLELMVSCENNLVIKWLEQTFKKDIKCGVSTKTINKIWPNLIPEFQIGLCETFEGKELGGEWGLEVKLDGLRCLTLIDELGNVSFLSRSGKQIFNFGHVAEEIKTLNLKNIVLDGEFFAGDWNSSISIAHTESNHPNKKQAKYFIFDILTLGEWRSRQSKSYQKRKLILKQTFNQESKYIKIVDYILINNMKGMGEFYKEILDQGFEGIVLKEINSQYPFKRSKLWLKRKPFISEDIEIVGWGEGEGRLKGKLGKFICNFNGVEVGVGGGYSDDLREKFWVEREQMKGKIIEVLAQRVTEDGSLLFPRFKRLRIDKE